MGLSKNEMLMWSSFPEWVNIFFLYPLKSLWVNILFNLCCFIVLYPFKIYVVTYYS